MAATRTKKKKQQAAIAEFTPPSDSNALVAWANKRLEDAHEIDEFQAKQNLAFVLGHQWGIWENDRKRFVGPSSTRGDPNGPVRITINKIGTLVERNVARLLKQKPEPQCRPVTDTDTDVNSAKVGTRILSHELERLGFSKKLLDLYFWAFPLGWSFFHLRWDPDAGAHVGTDDETEEPLYEGNITVENVPAFELKIDPNARTWEEARWCIRTVAMTKEACYDQYGIIPEGTTNHESLTDEWRLAGGGQSGVNSAGNRDRSGNEASQFVAVHQFWLRPGGRAKPEGCAFTWCGATILEEPQDYPYDHGELPFIPLNILPPLGTGPEGRTWVTDLISPQKDYNDSRSREAVIRRTLTPKVLAARGQIDPNRLTSRLEVIDYNPTGPKPEFMSPDGRWMAQFQEGMNRSDAEMGDRSGNQDVSQGKAASSAAAASIMALQEADETKLAISAKELSETIRLFGYQVLALARQFWEEERTIRTYSQDGQLQVMQYNKTNIADHLDVHVEAESGLPKSKAMRTQFALDLYSMGVFTDPADLVRIMDLPANDFLMERLNIDAKQAEREHAHLLQQIPVEVKLWENHAAHIAKHNELRKSEEYEQLPPEIQAHIDGHVQVHIQIQASQMMAQQQGMPPGMDEVQQAQAPVTDNPSGVNGEPTDPMTGAPQSPNQVMDSLAPTAMTGGQQPGPGGFGGAGNPGLAPGMPMDTQASRMGN